MFDFEADEIKKKVKVSYDGRQLMIRLPREISEFYDLKKGDALELSLHISASDERSNREIPMELKVIDNG